MKESCGGTFILLLTSYLLVNIVSVQGQSCSFNMYNRTDCRYNNEQTCTSAKCCWSPVDSVANPGIPWCFYPEGKEPSSIGNGPYVHLFEWKWTDIALECENFLAKTGYTAVQVSPPQEHRIVNLECTGRPWYERYQPVSYKLESRGGTREEFIDMVTRCNNVGVEIWVDAVINHMTGRLGPGVKEYGSAGTEFGYYKYENYTWDDFIHLPDYPTDPNCGIRGEDYATNASRVRDCDLLSLTDLNLKRPNVVDTIVGYLQDLINIGVKGFRIDASKHMWPEDLANVFSKLSGDVTIFHEVIDKRADIITYHEYVDIGLVTEFLYGPKLTSAFRSSNLKQLSNFGEEWDLMRSEYAISFIDNHDNQRGHGAGGGSVLTYRDGIIYELANIFELAWPYGYAQVMSSYTIVNSDAGPPPTRIWQNGRNTCFDLNSEWICEHRWSKISKMAKFRRATRGIAVNNWWSDQPTQIAFSRGNIGFVAINIGTSPIYQSIKTSLPAGTYCDILSMGHVNSLGNSTCLQFTVDNSGYVQISLGGFDALALLSGY